MEIIINQHCNNAECNHDNHCVKRDGRNKFSWKLKVVFLDGLCISGFQIQLLLRRTVTLIQNIISDF
jgi:hypothetical protein